MKLKIAEANQNLHQIWTQVLATNVKQLPHIELCQVAAPAMEHVYSESLEAASPSCAWSDDPKRFSPKDEPKSYIIRRPGSACTVILILCSIQKMYAKTPPNQNPKSKIRNPKSPGKSKFGAVGASHKGMLHNDPKSKIPKIRPKKFGFWILDWGILDFGFWIPDFGFWGGPGDVPLGNSVTVP